MNRNMKKILSFILILSGCLVLSACEAAVPSGTEAGSSSVIGRKDISAYLSFVDEEPPTMDPQCTSGYYTIPLNIFDRLVEVEAEGGESQLVPSLAERWEISEDGLTYVFHLRPEVRFSNGSPLTSEDVQFTMERLLTHPDSQSGDIVLNVKGAEDLKNGRSEHLEGFRVLDDLSFEITLETPFAPFLASLSTPGASILDAESTTAAGDNFGKTIEDTIGTGGFVLSEWIPGEMILLEANPDCFSGPPNCAGLRMLFLEDTYSQRSLFDSGQLDVLDLDYLGPESEYFIHGDIYRTNLFRGPRVGITYIALNESIEPLNDVRVRKALQLSLDRNLIMQAMIGGRGNVENGIFPFGLVGHNNNLETIPYDPEEAKALLSEAGYADGFDLTIYYTDPASESDLDRIAVVSSMWAKIGVRTETVRLSSDDYMSLRKQGQLSCYLATWSADYDDPDNFIYTFFGKDNTVGRSLCYGNEEVMERIKAARGIVNEEERMAEYQELERIIVQEDAAWVPLYSELHLLVVNSRVEGFELLWNGWSSNNYEQVGIAEK